MRSTQPDFSRMFHDRKARRFTKLNFKTQVGTHQFGEYICWNQINLKRLWINGFDTVLYFLLSRQCLLYWISTSTVSNRVPCMMYWTVLHLSTHYQQVFAIGLHNWSNMNTYNICTATLTVSNRSNVKPTRCLPSSVENVYKASFHYDGYDITTKN